MKNPGQLSHYID